MQVTASDSSNSLQWSTWLAWLALHCSCHADPSSGNARAAAPQPSLPQAVQIPLPFEAGAVESHLCEDRQEQAEQATTQSPAPGRRQVQMAAARPPVSIIHSPRQQSSLQQSATIIRPRSSILYNPTHSRSLISFHHSNRLIPLV